MNNYKIKVKTPEESKEAQELFLDLGYVKENWIWSGYNEYPIELRTGDGGYSDFILNAGEAIERQEITLPELRAMVHQEQDEPFLTPECTLNDQYAEIEQIRQHSHYKKDVSNLEFIDVYRVLKLFDVTDPCLQHAIKKLLCSGQRGAKSSSQDVQEAIDSLVRFQQMRIEDTLD